MRVVFPELDGVRYETAAEARKVVSNTDVQLAKVTFLQERSEDPESGPDPTPDPDPDPAPDPDPEPEPNPDPSPNPNPSDGKGDGTDQNGANQNGTDQTDSKKNNQATDKELHKNGQLSRTGAGVASAVIAAVALLAAGALAFVRRGRIRNR